MFKKILAALIIIILISGLFYLGFYLYLTKIKPSKESVSEPAPAETSSTSQPSILYASDFSKSDSLNDWTTVDDVNANEGPGDWKIENGALVQLSNIWAGTAGEPVTGKSYLGTEAYLKVGFSWSNYEVSAKFNPKDNDGVGFLVRYNDQSNYYKVMMVQDSEKDNGGPFIKIDKNLNGTYITLFQKPLTYNLSQDNEIRIMVNGPLIEVYLNSETKTIWATDPDSSFSQGTLGLACFAQRGVSFKDIKITEIK